MSLFVPRTGPVGYAAELALWSTAGLVVLSLHVGAAQYIATSRVPTDAAGSPPPAIMIELAAEPESADSSAEQVKTDSADQAPVETASIEPVVQQPEPEPEPVPVEEEVAELPPEPVIEPEPVNEEALPSFEEVEVPLPVIKPKPELPVKKQEVKKEPVKRVKDKPKPRAAPQVEMAQAKIEAKQSDRTAAQRNSVGFFSNQVTPQKWDEQVWGKIARNAKSCPKLNAGAVTISFTVNRDGSVGRVTVTRSSGRPETDSYVVAAVQRASPFTPHPSGSSYPVEVPFFCR